MKGILKWLIDATAAVRAIAVAMGVVASALAGVTVDGALTGGDVGRTVAGLLPVSSSK